MATSEKDYLAQYNIHAYDLPLVSVDVAIFTLLDGKLQVLLVKRAEHPYKGRWSLPGGFIDQQKDKDLQATALRKLVEKTGVKTPHLEQVMSLGNAKRDPRGWSVTALYMALIPHAPASAHIDTVADARWWPYESARAQSLAFDHAQLMEQARERLKAKSGYTLLPVYILNPPFTLTQLQQAFEELLETTIEKKSFRRRILAADLLNEAGEGLPEGGRGRTAVLYSPKKGSAEHAFVRSFGADGSGD
jgi:8-oxo-dGTP diphosphatase